MAYFNRKEIVRILAEKPDMISVFPESVLSAQQLADMANIPNIAVCDITMMADTQALDSMMLSKRPDAVLPAAVYCGVERVRWSNLDSTVAALKKTLERTWRVHVLPPVVLGAPLFRSALCLYAGMQAAQQTRSALTVRCLFLLPGSSLYSFMQAVQHQQAVLGWTGTLLCSGSRCRSIKRSFEICQDFAVRLRYRAGYGHACIGFCSVCGG